jgi:hypothetical protein
VLHVMAEGLTGAGAAVGAVGLEQGAATAAATPGTSALIPSGIDEVSVLAAAAFSAQGIGFAATSAQGSAMLALASEGMTAVAAAYDGVDAAGAARIL